MEFFSPVVSFFGRHWPELLSIAAVVILGKLGVRAITKRIIKAADDGDDAKESGKEKRAKTVVSVVRSTSNAVIGVIAAVMALRLFGVDTVPILAGAGVIGVAIGVSLQALIKDLITGLFIVGENQYAVGDRVKIGEIEGVVHRVRLRTTILLDDEGNLVFVTNGSITTVINYSLGADMKGKEPRPKAEAPSDTAPLKKPAEEAAAAADEGAC